jgi:predicted phosphodiesterase
MQAGSASSARARASSLFYLTHAPLACPLSIPVLTRILSDLHYDDSESQVRSLAMLKPLLEGADRIVINGDALDSQVIAPERARALISEVKAFFAAHTPETLFISGNHDPDISSVPELLLADGLIWLTHGDIFFEYVAPWSRYLSEYRRRIHALRDPLPAAERDRLDTRYRILRAACIAPPPERDPYDHSLAHRIACLLRLFAHPRRPLSMIHSWLTSPRVAAGMAARHHPSARFVIFGHIHHPGVWTKHRPRIVINTGSFTPPRGALMIEFDEANLRVLRIARRSGAFYPGAVIAEFPLAPQPRSS